MAASGGHWKNGNFIGNSSAVRLASDYNASDFAAMDQRELKDWIVRSRQEENSLYGDSNWYGKRGGLSTGPTAEQSERREAARDRVSRLLQLRKFAEGRERLLKRQAR